MKNLKRIAVLILCAVTVALACFTLVGCKNDTDIDDKGYIVLSFDLKWNGGTKIEPIILDGVEEKEMPLDPMRAGYSFGGWYLDEGCNEKFEAGVTALTKDTTLYARWIPNDIRNPENPIIENPKGLVYAEKKSDDGSIYYVVTGYKGEEKDVIIPSRYNSYPVNEIADKAFKGNTKIETVSFGLNIEKVGDEAFRNCTALKSITVANGSYYYVSVDGLLYNSRRTTLICAPSASALKKITFAKEVASIENYALANCEFEVEFASKSEYTEIDKYDFAGFKGKLTVGKSIAAIRQYAFKEAMCEIVFGDECAVNELGTGAFDGYKGAKLTVPATVTSLPAHVFNGCYAVIDLSKTGIKKLSRNSFAGYLGETLVIPAQVTDIEEYAFYKSTTKVTFASGSEYASVKTDSFTEFNGEIIFPFTVNKVEKNAFRRAQGRVTFGKAQSDITFDSGYDNEFKGEFIYA